MKVISQDGGIATLAYIADEVKPIKGLHLPALLFAIGHRYSSVKTPTIEEARTGGAKFENGTLSYNDKKIAIGQIALHNDAISVTTTDTDDSEIVLNDLFVWIKEEFKFRDPITKPAKIYQSDLVIRFDNDPNDSLGSIASFMKFIQEEMTPPNMHLKKEVKFAYIGFGGDAAGSVVTPEFTVARRLNVPWQFGLYFSKAHMRTPAHIRALEMLDGLLAQKS